MTFREPNTRPDLYETWEAWRATYSEIIADFCLSPRTASDKLKLRISLRRLGYDRHDLQNEFEYILGGGL